jgi:hypothetical protein
MKQGEESLWIEVGPDFGLDEIQAYQGFEDVKLRLSKELNRPRYD